MNPIYNVDSMLNPGSTGSTPNSSPPPPKRDKKKLSNGKVVIFPSSTHLRYWAGLVTGSEAIEIIDNVPSRSSSVNGDESVGDKIARGFKDMFVEKPGNELVLEDIDEDVQERRAEPAKKAGSDHSAAVPVKDESEVHPLA